MEKFRTPIILILLATILVGGILLILKNNTSSSAIEITLPTPSADITVHISGAVANPGVYVLHENALVGDAVEMAGGFTAEADRSAVNLAATLRNNSQVHIYAVDEASQRININTADMWLLDALPGIGEATAARIIQYRTENGPFQSPQDLKNVKGIGESIYEKLADKITVNS